MPSQQPPYNPKNLIPRLQDHLRRAAYPGLIDAALAPTITNKANYAATTIAGKVFHDYGASQNVYVFGGAASLYTHFSGGLNDGAKHNFYFGDGGGKVSGALGQLCVAFRTDAPQIDFMFSGAPLWTLLVDGKLAAASYITSTNTTNDQFLASVVFPARKLQTIVLSIAGDSAGFYVGPNDTVLPMTLDTPAIGFMTDSYGQSKGIAYAAGLALGTAAKLGLAKVRLDPCGGSGYVTSNTGVTPNPNDFKTRLGVSTKATPAVDLHVTCGGINDAALTAPQAKAYFQKVRSLFPTCVLAATGPWCPNGLYAVNAAQKYMGLRDSIKAGLAQAGGAWVFVDNLAGVWSNSSGQAGECGNGPWQTGAGYAGATTGTGNGDLYIDSGGTHPVPAGIEYLADRLGSALRASLLAL